MAKRQTKNQKEYAHQMKRINKVLKPLLNKGFVVEIPELEYVPKRITKQFLEKLKNIKPKQIRNKAFYVNDEGVKVSYREFKQEQDLIIETEFYSSVVERYKGYILGFPRGASSLIMEWLNKLLFTQGVECVGQMIVDAPYQLTDFLGKTPFDSDGEIREYMTAMMEYLGCTDQVFREELMEELEYGGW